MIKIEDLSFSYGNYEVLKGISFKMEEGKIYGLLGENGVGKTTLLTLIAGLKAPQIGSILVDGKKPYDRQPSFLENIFYLPDVVAPVRYKAIDFAKDRGKFWSKFSLDRFNQIMQLLENDPQRRMDKMSLLNALFRFVPLNTIFLSVQVSFSLREAAITAVLVEALI